MPDGNAAAQRVLGIGKALRKCDCEVLFCGLTRNHKKCEQGEIDGFNYINYPYPSSICQWIKYLLGRDNSISNIRQFKPDIVVLYNHPAFAIEHIYKYCNKHGIKVLADVTEWYDVKGSWLFKRIKGYDVERRMLKSNLKLDGLICISKYLFDFYVNKGIDVIEVPPLVDIDQKKWHQKKECASKKIQIIYAGSPGSDKDRIDLILQAIDKLIPKLKNTVSFDIIGITEEQYRQVWEDFREYSFVNFNGRLPHETVIRKLIDADFQVFLRPENIATKAGFPTKFVETITSCSLPITNLNSNLQDYIIDEVNGFVIKTLAFDDILRVLEKALTMSRTDINRMKNNIDSSTFDYRKYSELIKTLL